MKTLALVTSAALLLAGVSVASAQSTNMNKNEKPATPPSSINKGSDQPNARTSGTEPKAAAQTTTTRKHSMKKAKKHHKKKKVAASPAKMDKGTSRGTPTTGSQPKSMAK